MLTHFPAQRWVLPGVIAKSKVTLVAPLGRRRVVQQRQINLALSHLLQVRNWQVDVRLLSDFNLRVERVNSCLACRTDTRLSLGVDVALQIHFNFK